jgi:hypothetical protein
MDSCHGLVAGCSHEFSCSADHLLATNSCTSILTIERLEPVFLG